MKNRLTGFSLHFSLLSCGQACYTFAKLPADLDEADCVLTVSVSSTGGKCEYSGKVVPSFIHGDSTHVQYTQTDTIRQTECPLVPMVRLVPIEKHPIPMVLLVHMHLIKGT